MQISWINNFSLIEYPGEISCIVFTPGCNLRCGYCHNSEFVLAEKLKDIYNNLINEKSFFNFLEKRKGLLTGVSICGWEPTMQKDLIKFCEKVKSMWFLLKLDTNWRSPNIINELLEKWLVDYIAMDIKNEIWKFSISAWVLIDEKSYIKCIDSIMNSDIDYEFRTTVIKWIHNKNSIENIVKYIKWSKNYSIQNFKWWNTLDEKFVWKSFSEKELEEFKNIAEKYIQNVNIRN